MHEAIRTCRFHVCTTTTRTRGRTALARCHQLFMQTSVSFILLVIDKYKAIVELVLLDSIHIQVVLALVIFALTCNFVYIIESNDDDNVSAVFACVCECADLDYVCMNFSFSILIVISMRSRL